MSQQPVNVFNRKRKFKQLQRAAKTYSESDFLHRESADRLALQFDGLIKKQFDSVLVLGARNGYLSSLLKHNKNIGKVFEMDISKDYLTDNSSVIADEELLPFKDESFDLVISNLNLHWVNDLPGTLIQIKRILKKNGFFCANLFGGRTLVELRNALLVAEDNGSSPRVSPFIDVKDGAGLLQRTKFDEPVSVSEDIIVKYDSLNSLLKDLRNTGENNALEKLNNKFVGKRFFNEVEKIYREKFSDEDGNLLATAEIVTISGWKKT
jgi:NADH dehydrogenase [ubiquinone] 1 alpha subcomplex assembly factor 5